VVGTYFFWGTASSSPLGASSSPLGASSSPSMTSVLWASSTPLMNEKKKSGGYVRFFVGGPRATLRPCSLLGHPAVSVVNLRPVGQRYPISKRNEGEWGGVRTFFGGRPRHLRWTPRRLRRRLPSCGPAYTISRETRHSRGKYVPFFLGTARRSCCFLRLVVLAARLGAAVDVHGVLVGDGHPVGRRKPLVTRRKRAAGRYVLFGGGRLLLGSRLRFGRLRWRQRRPSGWASAACGATCGGTGGHCEREGADGW
jgi:hypothetical protein